MAKRNYARLKALKKAWDRATMEDRERFVIALQDQVPAFLEEASKSLLRPEIRFKVHPE